MSHSLCLGCSQKNSNLRPSEKGGRPIFLKKGSNSAVLSGMNVKTFISTTPKRRQA